MRNKQLKSSLLLLGALLACVVIPYLYWHGVWWGRQLDDSELAQYLSDEQPRRIQHALSQISERIEQGDSKIVRWYQTVAELAGHPLPEVRITAVWVLGQDPHSHLFHTRLLEVLEDPEPIVRRNAALSLVRFGDTGALPELRAMLESHLVKAPVAGSVFYQVAEGDWVDPGGLAARLIDNDGESTDVKVRVSGQVQDRLLAQGSAADGGDGLMLLSPDPKHVWESLRALYLIGGIEDLERVNAIAQDPLFSERIREQALLTVQAIERRKTSDELRMTSDE